jgi:energy-coupling factor transporter ATP-binding protein EcfA2
VSAAAEIDAAPNAAPSADEPTLVVDGLTTSIRIDRQWFDAVRDVSFAVHPRETLALVGESGCGKSLTALSVMGLLPTGVGRVSGGRITVDGVDMTAASAATAQAMRGDRNRHDLPGTDDIAEPGPADRLPDRRIARAASRHERAPGAPARARADGAGAHPGRRAAPRCLCASSSPAACGSG